MPSEITPQERNAIAWQDLGERIDRAVQELSRIDSTEAPERLEDKIAGVRGAQGKYGCLEAAGEPHLSIFIEWLIHRTKSLDAENQQALRSGYALVLDYTRAY